ncbi:hypothetical protein ACN2MM_05985 [Alkalilimnicola ehrlichii MLHE-1]|uniref:Uncharacterized protein n=1 Tax=Alkalilimnicola ehrlichii (strain ATCC BAA-1101 / DSM 17681 / MLHE-1) TaxID=187272 RepID=Q0A9R8_ALKEH|nr:hypothetical protein [Alkalilimnicola ehrlichii]ABI56419.1 hypothetical protein Mlg_1067 [Alkalilimnicola ehrlichii MLHE-1]
MAVFRSDSPQHWEQPSRPIKEFWSSDLEPKADSKPTRRKADPSAVQRLMNQRTATPKADTAPPRRAGRYDAGAERRRQAAAMAEIRDRHKSSRGLTRTDAKAKAAPVMPEPTTDSAPSGGGYQAMVDAIKGAHKRGGDNNG